MRRRSQSRNSAVMTFKVGDVVAYGAPGRSSFNLELSRIGFVFSLTSATHGDEWITVLTENCAEHWHKSQVRRLFPSTLE